MLSFISTSKKTKVGRLEKALMVSFGFFLIFFMAGKWISAHKPEWTHQDPLLPSNYRNLDSFSLFEAFGGIDRTNVLYYAVGPMISWAQKADVLVLGNSRPFFAFRDDFVKAAEKKSELKFFSLAGPGDNFPYCREIILRNHLFPKFMILNEDNFFNPKLWPFQKEVMTSSWWHGWSSTYINYFQWLGKYYLRKGIPELTFFMANHGKERLTLCSPTNGFVFMENISGDHHPLVESSQKSTVNPLYLEMARKFIGEMKDRGSEVILTFVPDGQNTDFVREEAKELGVPFILPKLNGLETYDGKHLTPESSERYTKAFFKIFFKLPEVQKVIRELECKAMR